MSVNVNGNINLGQQPHNKDTSRESQLSTSIKMASEIKPYKISVPESSLATLKSKLKASVFADDTDFSDNWDYGAPSSDVKRLAKYWADGFDWRKQEAKLNELPQFSTQIEVDGFGELGIHFLHQRSEQKGSIPLLFCHGCKSSLDPYRVELR